MASRIKRIKPDPNHPDGWDSSAPQKEPAAPKAPASSFEDALYQILSAAFSRSDAAARATARLDYQLALQQTTEQPEEAPAEGGAIIRGSSQEFDDREFLDTFERLSFLRMVLDLVAALDLQHLQPELLQALIDERFRSKPSQSRSAPESSTIAGSDLAVLLHNLKRAAERRARTEPRVARAAAK